MSAHLIKTTSKKGMDFNLKCFDKKQYIIFVSKSVNSTVEPSKKIASFRNKEEAIKYWDDNITKL